jgi:hypothetical protein
LYVKPVLPLAFTVIIPLLLHLDAAVGELLMVIVAHVEPTVILLDALKHPLASLATKA